MPQTIVGSGFIAKNLRSISSHLQRKKAVIYASGISNSKTKNSKDLRREINEILKYIRKKKNNNIFIYISTCSITDNNRNKTPYVRNKIKIEKLIKNNLKNYLIIRLPEVAGKNSNKKTITNFLKDKIKNKKKFVLWVNVKRNILDINDVRKLIKTTLSFKIKNKIINIANTKFYKPIDIILIYEKIFKKKAFFDINKKKQEKWRLDLNITKKIIKKAKLNLNNNYLNKVLRKNI